MSFEVRILLFSFILFFHAIALASNNEVGTINSLDSNAELTKWQDGFSQGLHPTLGIGAVSLLVLPLPFVEAGVNYNRFALRTSLGFVFAHWEAKGELAYLCSLHGRPFSAFTNFGFMANIMSAGYIWGLGADIDSRKYRRFYRMGVDLLGFLGSTNGSMDLRDGMKIFTGWSVLPRIGIGYRF